MTRLRDQQEYPPAKKTFVQYIHQEAVWRFEDGVKVRDLDWADLRERNDRKEAKWKSKGGIPVELVRNDTQGNEDEEDI